ncbi:CRISPR-associated protein Cmr4 [Candidatus Hakubella thermalkaliphila]|nr:CRISPR-associated protein Cmr4 [Candidatus Hakubella thermalkaliphila]GFP37366.1 CRISPR-associated protein Cmr4 [Candidatus Hakubella thermalkaliphila]
MFLYAETPVHAGSGSGVAGIDLPIQRERFTNLPILQPSGLKGALREFFENGKGLLPGHLDPEIFTIFGPDERKASENAGALCIEEARLLLFPVRSLKGVFAYTTCPIVLRRFYRDLEVLKHLGQDLIGSPLPDWLSLTTESIPDDQVWTIKPAEISECKILSHSEKITLEEFTFTAVPKGQVSSLAEWLDSKLSGVTLDLAARLAVMSDNTFRDFVEFSTEVITRTRIDDEKGTVVKGALWTEEHLPRESVLYCLLLSCKPLKSGVTGLSTADEVLNYITNNTTPALRPAYLWLGGNQTVGRGLVHVVFS